MANWMTSMHREDEIADYIEYLNLLLIKIEKEYPGIPISVVGFSQGVSTLLRWLVQSKSQINYIHLCAGTIPPELNKSDFFGLKQSTFRYYYGSFDKVLKPEKAMDQIAILRNNQLIVDEVSFEGRHEVPRELLNFLTAIID